MARNPGADAVEDAEPVLAGGAASPAPEFDLMSFVRAQERRLCAEWLAVAADEEAGTEAAAVFGALVDALEPNGGWWLDVTAESLVEAGVRPGDVTHQLERIVQLVTARIRAEHGEPTAEAATADLTRAAEDLVAACGRRNDAS